MDWNAQRLLRPSPFSTGQQVGLALAPKITGFVSLFFSALIVATVVRGARSPLIVCWPALAASIFARDFGWLCRPGPFQLHPVSSGQRGQLDGVHHKVSFYNSASPLTVYYLLVIKDRVRRIEPLRHGMPFLWSVSTAISGLFLKLFNNANLWCWLAPLPGNCSTDPDTE